MKVKIENLKGISRIEFEIPGAGLWLLTGLNGSGKTSLLAALYRIKYSRAFPQYYRSTATQKKLDTFANSKISYTINGSTVAYSYAGQRWPPTPRKNSVILSEFPYPSIQFIEANANRIEPFPNEIRATRIRSATAEIQSFMSDVLNDSKWNNLRYVNTRRGRGSEAFLLPYRTGRETHYYSEKNFSLGELCALRLARQMSQSEEKSMILIDEIEMALHPQAQVRLLRKIRELANQKNFTVIFSTHSSTLIKNINRRSIIFLSTDTQGIVTTQTGVFPAQILGEMAYDEELDSDFIFFVEDEQAKFLLEQLCGKYEEQRSSHKPLYKIVPVGGFFQTMQMLERSTPLFPPHVNRFVFLDDDVRTEALPAARTHRTTSITDLFERVRERTKFLPCTPEIGVVEMLESSCNSQSTDVEVYGTVAHLNQHVDSSEYTSISGNAPRNVSKKKLDSIVQYIIQKCGNDETTVRRILYRKYVDNLHASEARTLMELLGPVFNVRDNRQ